VSHNRAGAALRGMQKKKPLVLRSEIVRDLSRVHGGIDIIDTVRKTIDETIADSSKLDTLSFLTQCPIVKQTVIVCN
jgi:hypothetical protein